MGVSGQGRRPNSTWYPKIRTVATTVCGLYCTWLKDGAACNCQTFSRSKIIISPRTPLPSFARRWTMYTQRPGDDYLHQHGSILHQHRPLQRRNRDMCHPGAPTATFFLSERTTHRVDWKYREVTPNRAFALSALSIITSGCWGCVLPPQIRPALLPAADSHRVRRV